MVIFSVKIRDLLLGKESGTENAKEKITSDVVIVLSISTSEVISKAIS